MINTNNNSLRTVALLEDQPEFAFFLINDLSKIGYQVSHFKTGNECLTELRQTAFDICLFDLNLPDMTGLDVMTHLRAMGRMPPVIFLTSNDAEETIEHILLSGADDYVIKPPSLPVLQARMQSVLRRTKGNDKPTQEQLGSLMIDHVNQKILLNSEIVNLTSMERAIIFILLQRRGEIVPRQVLNAVLDVDESAIDTRRLDVHISRIRAKLKMNAAHGWKLSSIYQRGYRIEYFDGGS